MTPDTRWNQSICLSLFLPLLLMPLDGGITVEDENEFAAYVRQAGGK